MDVDQPPPDDPDYTAAQHKRSRADSEYSTSPEGSIHSTRTLKSEDFEFVKENGRIYGNHTYFLPCDQAEQDRLAIQHQVFLHILKGKLTTTPITPLTRRVLDLGTGPGDWAVAMAQQYPHIEVVGVDMAVWDIDTTEAGSAEGCVTWELDDLDVWGPESDEEEALRKRLNRYDPFLDPTHRNPTETPSRAKQREGSLSRPDTRPQTPTLENLSLLEADDEEQPGWNFSQPFDLIHLRNMKGSFASWEEIYAEIYKNLNPGGYVEVADYEVILPEMLNQKAGVGEASSSTGSQADKDADADNYSLPTVRKLYLTMMQASFKAGRPLGNFYMHPTYLEDAGFKDVRTTYVNVPVGQWPEDPEQRRIGKMFLVVFMESLEAHLLRLATKVGDAERRWTAEEVREQIEIGKREVLDYENERNGEVDVRKEVKGWCANFKWVVGRKSKNA